MNISTLLKILVLTMISVALPFKAMSHSEKNKLGVFSNNQDVGAPKFSGNTDYNPEQQSYVLSGSGTNIWAKKDEFQFAYREITGDFIIRANMAFIGEGVDAHRKIGLMVRHSLEADSPHAISTVHGDGLTSLQYRPTVGVDMQEKAFDLKGADVLQLERKGNTYIMSAAKHGDVFVEKSVSKINLGDKVYVGLFISAHNADVLEKARFHNVRLVKPPKEGYQPYRDYIGSHIEVLDVASGKREMVYSAVNSLQAPNWMHDNNIFTYNSEGSLYDFDLRTKQPVLINAYFANAQNNDHVYSSKGDRIGISHHTEEENWDSVIYTIPRQGGKPIRVTPNAPSYLHGWSPDDKYMVYTAIRDGKTNLYKIPVAGGDEIQLTDTEGLDDGSEYTPDGKYIYFNSNRTGTSQIWRMRPDGDNPEQLTFDELNDWFPHISPDGKWVVFISFPNTIDSGDHPFYQRVYVRLMPLDGGEPKVLAYVYGGQGTMNVPNWSPDGKKIAFVSNSALLNY
jgi:Tol biopolymer transport system component